MTYTTYRPVRLWFVTGTNHGSHIYAKSEGDARRTFHAHYNGESITHVSGPHLTGPVPALEPNDIDTF